MKRDRTISDAIKIVLKDKPEGMTAEQIYKEIIDNNLYKFNARNSQSVVVSTIRRSCVGVDNKSSIRDKEFAIAREMDNDIYYILNDNSAYESQDNQGSYDYTDNNTNNIVKCWLLNWNPSNPTWQWEEQEDDHGYNATAQKVKSGGTVFFSWRCSSKKVKEGDRFFMVKLGAKPRGVFATGYAASDTYENTYTDENGESITERCVDICITGFLDYHVDELISQDVLKQKFPEQQWSSQGAGISIKPEASKWLIENWDSFTKHNKGNPTSETENISTETVIWKISYGTPQTSGITTEIRQILESKKVVIVNQLTNRLAVQNTPQGQVYMNEIKKGDYFYLCYAGEIVLFGQFISDDTKLNQEMVHEWNDYDWYERPYRLIARSLIHDKYTGTKKIWTSNYNSTCVKVTDNELFEELILQPYFGLKISDLSTTEFHEPYTKEKFLKEVFLTEPEYDKLRSLVLRKKNIILQGAPGVGKTFSAKRLAYSIIGEKNENRICMVQFHQNYSYEDFIMGYRPNDGGGFELQSGVFYNFCIRCKENPDKPYFFIIDEINRGNLSKIFGELLMLIETDKRGEKHKLNLVYGGTAFYIPENLHIIGMMNTADRSLAMIDYALRRRFSFYTMQPAFENADQNGFGDYTADIQCELYHSVIAKIRELNDTIRKDSTLGKGFEIGHSYFAPENKSEINDEWVRGVVYYEIIPLIEEYWFDDDKKVDEWTKALYQVLGDQNDR
ncbi:MAG TPA: AAA family ATPase [Ruminococcus sp.]